MGEGGPEGRTDTSGALQGPGETNKQILKKPFVPDTPVKVTCKVNLYFVRKFPDTRGVAQWDTGCLVSLGCGFDSQH